MNTKEDIRNALIEDEAFTVVLYAFIVLLTTGVMLIGHLDLLMDVFLHRLH